MDIEKTVNDTFAGIAASGFIEKTIKEQLEKTIKDVIEDSMRSYSDFGKQIKEKVTEALSLGKMELSLPVYNQLVCNWIGEIVNQQLVTNGKEQVEKNIKSILQPLEKSEWKISEIIDRFKESCLELGDVSSGDVITFASYRDTTGYTDFYFDKKSDESKYNCGYNISTDSDGAVFTVKIDDCNASEVKIKPMYGFDGFVFKLFATKAKIIDDSENVDDYVSDRSDDF